MKKAARKTERMVRFELVTAPGSEVYVAGSFNNWDPKHTKLKDNPNSGVYRAALTLAPGKYEYRFVVNGDWCVDPNCAESVVNAFGSQNSIVTV